LNQDGSQKDTGNNEPNMVQVRGIEDQLFPEDSRLVQLSRVFMSLTPEEQSDIRHLYNTGIFEIPFASSAKSRAESGLSFPNG